MNADWPEFQLGIRCSVKSSKRIFAKEYVEDGIPFFRSKDVIDKSLGSFSEYNLFIPESRYKEIKEKFGSPKKGDVLISSVGNRSGQPYVVQDEGDFYFKDGNILWLSEFDNINPDFLAYWFKSDIGQSTLKSVMIGSAQKALTIDAIRKLWVRFPPIDFQDKAAEILKTLDGKIKLNRQTNQTLEHIAQAIFKSWFVDFEPVKTKIQANQNGQNPERAAMCVISGKSLEELEQLSPETQQQLKTTAALFPNALVESELGEIPEGWVCSEIGREAKVVGGGTPSTKNDAFWEGGDIHWTSPKDMSNLTDKILLNTSRKITEAGLDKISSGLLPENTVLMSSRAPVGYLAIAKIPVAINQGYIAMKCDTKLTPEYVVQWAESVMDDIKQRASGTTFAEISKKNFKIIPVIVPPCDVINEYSKIISTLYSKITEGIRENECLIRARDLLLPKLLSGELSLETTQMELEKAI